MLHGDAAGLLKEVVKITTLKEAFRYALRDRHKEWFYDPFELEWAERNQAAIIAELADDLKNPHKYEFKPAFAYFAPKTELCYRRMIYIPFKDLVTRYAFTAVVTDLIDPELSPNCFANRRDDDPVSPLFLEDFASVSWPNFCKWQRNNSKNGAYGTLLKTDISAFYDTVSHNYLITEMASSLNVAPGSNLMKFFRRLLRVPVLSYCHLTRTGRAAETMQQGLTIGSATDGALANIYLNAIDRHMALVEDIEFGRYNDDMRIFAKDRITAKRAMLILQERLLTKGLNLNSTKTEFADDENAIEDLRSRAYQGDAYFDEDEDTNVAPTRPKVTDLRFDEFSRPFSIGEAFEKDKDAKEFCHFLGKRITLSERQPGHINMLHEVLTEWHGSGKFAAWRLVETIVRKECPRRTRQLAEKLLLECLTDANVTNYAKYRLIHYLVKPRMSAGSARLHRYTEHLQSATLRAVKELLPSFVSAPAFELNIIALYAMRTLGTSFEDLHSAVRENACRPVPLPIRNALFLARPHRKAKVFPVLVPVGDEEVEVDDYH